MLAPRDRGILQDLRETGQSDEAAKKIEAVRIVYVSESESGGDAGGENAGGMEMSPEKIRELMQSLHKSGGQAGSEMAQDPKIKELLEKGGDFQANFMAFLQSPEGAEFRKKIESAVSSTMAGTGAGAAGGSVITLAIQEPGESYALAWSARKAGEGWMFSALPTDSATRARASEWDGKSAVVGFTPDKPQAEASEAGRPDLGGGGGNGSGGSGSNSPSSPPPPEPAPSPGTKKNTPAGPVRIPGGG
jgi:hypothetical protein